MKNQSIQLFALEGIPLIKQGDNIGALVAKTAEAQKIGVQSDDIIVIAQKIVSKAEGRTVDLKTVTPSERAQELARQTGRDPRLCQVYLNESREVLRVKGRHVVVLHRLGFECTGAGVDRSNVAPHAQGIVTLLPEDPDRSAREIREAINAATGQMIAVIINDSFGRRERDGSLGIAIGIAGIGALETRDQRDLFDNPSKNSIALIDELAGAASILMGQADEKVPAVLIRGVAFTRDENATIKTILVE